MKKILYSITSVAGLFPGIALAQPVNANPSIAPVTGLLGQAQGFVDAAIPFVLALALLFFFWGLAIFILNAGNEEARARGRSIMIWGIVALFVIVSVWGLVNVLGGLTGVPQSTAPTAPTPPQ